MILVSGFNVYPNEIEDVVMQHPKVMEVAIGVADEKSGRTKNFICPKKISPHLMRIIILQTKSWVINTKIRRNSEELPKNKCQ